MPKQSPIADELDKPFWDACNEGRLVIQPTVSWHRDEYDALGVPFEKRGRILDEQLAKKLA